MTQEQSYIKYRKKTLVQIPITLNRNTDSDILQKLDSVPNKQGYIKRLIRNDIAKAETFTVKPEYIDLWSNDSEFAKNPVVTMEEIKRLAREWDKPVETLLEQVEQN